MFYSINIELMIIFVVSLKGKRKFRIMINSPSWRGRHKNKYYDDDE